MYQISSVRVDFEDGAQVAMNAGGIHTWPAFGKSAADYRKLAMPLMYAPTLLDACRSALAFMESVVEFNESRGASTPEDALEVYNTLKHVVSQVDDDA